MEPKKGKEEWKECQLVEEGKRRIVKKNAIGVEHEVIKPGEKRKRNVKKIGKAKYRGRDRVRQADK